MRKRLVLALYVIVALLAVQTLRVHVHAYDHAPAAAHDIHHDNLHLGDGTPEEDDGMSVDLTRQGLLKKVSAVAVFLPVLILLLVPSLLRQTVFPPSFLPVPRPSWRGLQPPLRAPPNSY